MRGRDSQSFHALLASSPNGSLHDWMQESAHCKDCLSWPRMKAGPSDARTPGELVEPRGSSSGGGHSGEAAGGWLVRAAGTPPSEARLSGDQVPLLEPEVGLLLELEQAPARTPPPHWRGPLVAGQQTRGAAGARKPLLHLLSTSKHRNNVSGVVAGMCPPSRVSS